MSDQVARVVLSATDNASAVINRVRGSLADVGTTASKIGPLLNSLGVSLSAGLATAFIRGIVNGLDALNDLRDATGASIENISALEDVARRTGGSFETVSSSLIKFNQALNTAKPGSDAAAAFELLGLKISELKALDPAEALLRTATALASFADDGNKARITQEFFGKSLREAAPFLKDLAEAGKLNATVTTKQAEEAEKFNKELFRLQKNSVDTARSLAGPLVEGLNAVIEKFRDAKAGGNSFFMSMNEITAKAKAKSDAMFTGSWYVGNAGRGSVNPSSVKPSVGQIPDPVKKEVAARQSEAERYLEQLQRQLEKTQDLTVIEQVLTDIEKGRIKGITPEIQKQLEATAHLIDAANFQAAADKEQIKLQKEVADMYDRSAEAARRYVAGLVNENQQAEQRNKQLSDTLEEMGLEAAALDRLKLARIDASIAQQEDVLQSAQREQAGEAVIGQYEKQIKLLRELRSITEATASKRVRLEEEDANKKRTEALSKSIEDGILTGFRNGKGFADVFLDELKAQFAKTILRPIISPIAEAGSNLIGSFLGNLLSFDGGGYTGSAPRAGGLDGKGGFLGLIHPQESIIDHAKGGRGGFSASTQIVVQGGMSKAETYSAINAALQERDRAWSDHLRAQGVLA